MKYILALLVLASCAPTIKNNCNFVSGGLCVSSYTFIDPNEVSIIIQVVENMVNKYYPEVKKLANKLKENNTVAYFIKENLVRDCIGVAKNTYICYDNIYGINIEGNIIYLEYHNHSCLASMALAHELLHSIEYFYLNGPKGDHETPYMFIKKSERPELTLEYQIAKYLKTILFSCKEY